MIYILLGKLQKIKQYLAQNYDVVSCRILQVPLDNVHLHIVGI